MLDQAFRVLEKSDAANGDVPAAFTRHRMEVALLIPAETGQEAPGRYLACKGACA